ncbi:PREDICTED: putative RING-H2 finger protein ATL21A isoform X2 [Ipomoea nil]|uniref:putative RING-H2 finger protein ATL21A isoform X2 n=1 Tax=Ipomoea nil TaxID=35883 RepID=UPI0009013364|nr:PREDICTED: putative RING-H2 finger protein ATL21A isoform X2 [Ipomoea nil]
MHMAIFQALLLLLFVYSSLLIHAMAGDCQSSSCSEGGVSVRFPFGLENHQSFMSCAYNPLFSLKCSTSNYSSSTTQQRSPLVFNLPSSGDFFVRNINYLKQEIQLYDPSNCLPKRFLKLDLSFSPFKPLSYTNYTFLRCPKHAVKHPSNSFSIIDCLSNSTVSVLATSSMSVVRAMNICEPYAANLHVPVSRSGQSQDWFSSDFRLRWNAPDCRRCEAQGGVCAFAPFADYTIQDIACSFDNATTPAGTKSSVKKGTRIFWIIVVCIILPGVAFMSCMWCLKKTGVYITKQLSRSWYRRSRSRGAVHNPSEMPTTSVPTPLFTAEAEARVFEDDIGSSSRRNRCAICLQDNQPWEQRPWLMLQQQQGCQHSFHPHCLAQWLEFNQGCWRCPACYWDSLITSSPEMEMATARTSPTPQPTMSSSSSFTNSMATADAEHSTSTLLYTAKVFEDSEWVPRRGENSCAICRDKYVAQEKLGLVNGCQHSFHAHCLQSWLDTSPTCPLCRNTSLSSIPT